MNDEFLDTIKLSLDNEYVRAKRANRRGKQKIMQAGRLCGRSGAGYQEGLSGEAPRP
jgi:hypothetical protein